MLSQINRLLCECRNVYRLLDFRAYARWQLALATAMPMVLRKKSLGPVDDCFGANFRFRSKNGPLEIQGGSFGLVREIFGQECYVTPGEIADCRVILDLGTNCGTFALFALVYAPQAMVLGVEALPILARLAQSNIALNRFGGR